MKKRAHLVPLVLTIFIGVLALYVWKSEIFYREIPNITIPIFVYHNIRPSNPLLNTGELFITPELFEKQLEYLKKHGYTTLSFQDIIAHFSRGIALPEKSVILSFDDAWEGQYTYALPLLKKYGYTATFFVWTDIIGKGMFLSWEELRGLDNAGMVIGGHAKSHPHLVNVTDRALLQREIIDDKTFLEKRIGKPIKMFAYPYGEYNDTVTSFVKKAEYKAARTVGHDLEYGKDDIFTLPGILVENNLDRFTAILKETQSFKFKKERERWAREIESQGAKRAYEEFKNEYRNTDAGIQHLMAHHFGELLYGKRGVEGLAICDSTFIFGCYHSFLGKAIEAKGLSVLPELDRICQTKGKDWLGCHHGIGHGILAYLGYGKEQLVKALEACATLSWKGQVGGCTGGLFMEYNFRTMLDQEGVGEYIRPLGEDGLYEPCSWLPEKFLPACYYEQPDWWRHVLNNNWEKISQLCKGVNNEEQQEFCFIGLGRVVVQSIGFNIEKTIAICKTMPSRTKEILCRAGGFLSLIDYTHNRLRSASLCNSLSKSEKTLCLQKANLFGTTTDILYGN